MSNAPFIRFRTILEETCIENPHMKSHSAVHGENLNVIKHDAASPRDPLLETEQTGKTLRTLGEPVKLSLEDFINTHQT